MSELDAVKQLIEKAREQVTSAKTMSEQAQQVAGDKMNEMAMLGLEGVATALNAVADAMGTAVGQLGAAYSTADEAVKALDGVTDATKISETVKALNTAVEKLGGSGTEVGGAGANADDALVRAQDTEVEPVMAAVVQAVGAIGEAQSGLQTAATKASAHASQVEQSAKGLLAGAVGGTAENREPIAKIGDQLQEPSEIADHEGDSKRESRLSRLGKVAAQQSAGVNKDAKMLTNHFIDAAQSFRRLPDAPVESATGTAQPHPSIDRARDTGTAGDVTSTLLTVTLGTVAYFKSRSDRKKLRKGSPSDL